MKERTFKRILKASIASMICSFAIGVGLSVSGVIVHFGYDSKGLDVDKKKLVLVDRVNEFGYEDFNKDYRQQQLQQIQLKHNQGLIDDEQFISSISGIKNYSKSEYFKEHANAELKEEYDSLTAEKSKYQTKSEDWGKCALAGLGPVGVGMASVLF